MVPCHTTTYAVRWTLTRKSPKLGYIQEMSNTNLKQETPVTCYWLIVKRLAIKVIAEKPYTSMTSEDIVCTMAKVIECSSYHD
jgi:hypothetical protein